MKKLILSALALAALASTSAQAHDVYVNGYERANGTVVQPYVRTSPNGQTWDNYGGR